MIRMLEQIEDLLNLDSLVVVDVTVGEDMVVIFTAHKSETAICPKYGRPTDRLHQQEPRFITQVCRPLLYFPC